MIPISRLIKKHCFHFLPYLSVRKILNLSMSFFERSIGRIELISTPVVVKIESSPFCNLHCKYCAHSDPQYNILNQLTENMSTDILMKFISPMAKNIIGASLSVNGEPFMNPELCKLINMLHRMKIATTLPTHFSFKFSDDELCEIVKSGLDSLYISLDGINKEDYLKYRDGGDYDQVLDNVRRLSLIKKQMKNRKPTIVWKFILFEYNRSAKEHIKNHYKEYGFDSFEFVENIKNQTSVDIDNKLISLYNKHKKPCLWPWSSVILRANGSVVTCCARCIAVGDIREQQFPDIWNGNAYKQIRRGFSKKTFPKEMHQECKICYRNKTIPQY